MGNHVKELTEGMQRLCAVANRVVQSQGAADRIEVDLLLECLRGLYATAMDIAADTQAPRPSGLKSQKPEEAAGFTDYAVGGGSPTSDEEMAKVSTMAALSTEFVEEKKAEEATKKRVEPVDIPADSGLLFDEVIVEGEEEFVEDEEEVRDKKEEEVKESEEEEKEEVIMEKVEEKSEKEKEEGQVSLLDYLNKPSQRTLGESLAEGIRSSEFGIKGSEKVDDLRTVININDKFSFMSELFGGNMKAYNDFIMRLNATAEREEALAHVHDIATQQRWDEASPTVQAFYKVFDKKF
ncbi:MAG: hypothetical protein IK058_05520 [Bacteroidales bacterium]|nr:hypothetical protein [Bacteroidales bacterium]